MKLTVVDTLAISLILHCLISVGASKSPASCDSQSDDVHECSIWVYQNWVIAGKNYARNSPVGWQDAVVPFHQRDRRAFPRFLRFHYFLQVPNKPHYFVFAPALNFPFECHERLYNLRMMDPIDAVNTTSRMSPLLVANHAIQKGDPLFLECRHEDLHFNVGIDDYPSLDEVLERGACLDAIVTKSSTLPGVKLGVFATVDYKEGDTILRGPAIHMHRSEFQSTQEDGLVEELLNYCYGHSKTDLLLLPIMPMVNSMNHNAEKSNVRVRLDLSAKTMEYFYSKPTEIAFGESEKAKNYIAYIADRDIQAGEELFLDYGQSWSSSWEKRDLSKPFRHEIGLPDDFFPQSWLDDEVRNKPYPEIEVPKLQAGVVDHVRLNTGDILGSQLHRVGLPGGFTEKMAKWADDMGITSIMEDYILGTKTLEKDGQMRVRINGGNWWIKRFDRGWQSNMHYITPDDDESNEQYMHALGEAGFDQVLAGIGNHFGLDKLSCFYASFIAVSHASFTNMHSDSDHDTIWNLLFPTHQVNDTDAEINLGSSVDGLIVPYKYEPEHATLLGLDGMHGTAPTDYRGVDGRHQMRMVASVYMGDFNSKNVDGYVEEWEEPPYPLRENLWNALMHRTHWSATDPTKKCGLPQVNDFSALE